MVNPPKSNNAVTLNKIAKAVDVKKNRPRKKILNSARTRLPAKNVSKNKQC